MNSNDQATMLKNQIAPGKTEGQSAEQLLKELMTLASENTQ